LDALESLGFLLGIIFPEDTICSGVLLVGLCS